MAVIAAMAAVLLLSIGALASEAEVLNTTIGIGADELLCVASNAGNVTALWYMDGALYQEDSSAEMHCLDTANWDESYLGVHNISYLENQPNGIAMLIFNTTVKRSLPVIFPVGYDIRITLPTHPYLENFSGEFLLNNISVSQNPNPMKQQFFNRTWSDEEAGYGHIVFQGNFTDPHRFPARFGGDYYAGTMLLYNESIPTAAVNVNLSFQYPIINYGENLVFNYTVSPAPMNPEEMQHRISVGIQQLLCGSNNARQFFTGYGDIIWYEANNTLVITNILKTTGKNGTLSLLPCGITAEHWGSDLKRTKISVNISGAAEIITHPADVNGDFNVTIADVGLVNYWVRYNVALAQCPSCDVNGDGLIDPIEAQTYKLAQCPRCDATRDGAITIADVGYVNARKGMPIPRV